DREGCGRRLRRRHHGGRPRGRRARRRGRPAGRPGKDGMMRFLPEFLRLRGALALLLFVAVVMPGFAAAQERTLRLAGVVSEARMAPLVVSLSVHLPGTRLVYSRLSSAQIAAAARRPHDAPFDIAFLSSPDVAVSIANEGY